MLEVQRMRSEAGYWYPPEEPESDWDRHYNGFELWLNENYDEATGTVFGMVWDAACESQDLLDDYISMMQDDYDGGYDDV